MSHIFISYNQSDADFAAVLSIHIERVGIDTWMDKSRLRPGQDWSAEIDEAIVNSHALVVIMSPEAKASEYVTYEWSFALGAGVQVIPILYKETTLHPRLARLHYLKFTDTTVRPWETLVETVKEAVNNSGVYAVRIPRNAPSHVKNAVIALDSANDADRDGGIRVLAQTDHPTAREALLMALEHPLRNVRWGAALCVSGDDRAVPQLVDAFLNVEASLSQEVYGQYARHLADFGHAGMKALIEILTAIEGDWDRRVDVAIDALGAFEEGEAVPGLLQLLHDPNPVKRRRGAMALRFQPPELVEEELLNALNDDDKEVRIRVIHALQQLTSRGGSNKTWEGLLLGLKDTSLAVRNAASDCRFVRFSHEKYPDFFREKLISLTKAERLVVALAAYRALLNNELYTRGEIVELGLSRIYTSVEDIPLGSVLASLRSGSLVLYASVLRGDSHIMVRRIMECDDRAVIDANYKADVHTGTNDLMPINLILDPDTLESEHLKILT